MSEGRGCRLTEVEANILLESGFFWPGFMLDKATFHDLLASVLSLDLGGENCFEYHRAEWEKRLVATGALGNDGK
eukprot:710846-Amphidinium_carterae.2